MDDSIDTTSEYMHVVPGADPGDSVDTARGEELAQRFKHLSRQIQNMQGAVRPPFVTSEGLSLFDDDIDEAMAELDQLRADVNSFVQNQQTERLLLGIEVDAHRDGCAETSFRLLGDPKVNVLVPLEDGFVTAGDYKNLAGALGSMNDLRIRSVADRLTIAKYDLYSQYDCIERLVVTTLGTGMSGGKMKGRRPLMEQDGCTLKSIDLLTTPRQDLEKRLKRAIYETNREYYFS